MHLVSCKNFQPKRTGTTQADLANLPDLPNSVKIKNHLNVSKVKFKFLFPLEFKCIKS